MDVSRKAPDVTTKPKCYDLINVLVRVERCMLSTRTLVVPAKMLFFGFFLLAVSGVWSMHMLGRVRSQ